MMNLRCVSLFALLSIHPWHRPVEASLVPCTETAECEAALGLGSMCIDSVCTNTYYNGGCLKNALTNWTKTRICNSQDPLDAETLGYCRKSPMGYTEIRLRARNWESANFVSWLMQILLSELLEIPTSVESGSMDVNMNLYKKHSDFDFWNVIQDMSLSDLALATQIGACDDVTNMYMPESYQSCAHVYPESWTGDLTQESQIDMLEPFQDLGMLGESAMFVPLFAVKQDSSLGTYVGLQGEANRRKVAETFKRPTRWGQYCHEVSPSNCSKPDRIAQRAPLTQEEEASFFQEGTYNGHFRLTEEGNCDKYPASCTGHFVDFACGWYSFAQPLAYHLNIPFAFEGPELNGGYSSTEAGQIWAAANATKSPVAMYWWSPQPLLASYIGTDAEFTRVLFPTPTQKCVDSRFDIGLQCNPDVTLEEKMGDPAGACDDYPVPLATFFSKGLLDITKAPDMDEVFWSPAYDTLHKFEINNLQMDRIFEYWQQRGTDTSNVDPREAVCQWFVENLDLMNSFVPESHPRAIEEATSENETTYMAALAVAVLAGALVFGSIITTYRKRKTKAIYNAQPELLFLIQFGMLLTIGGALTYTMNPSSAVCGLSIWLTNLGYVFQLIPLWMRISAINQLAASGKRMERARITVWKLYAGIAAAAVLVAVYLLVWTLVDPSIEQFEYELTDIQTPEGATIVVAYDYCGSENDIWFFLSLAWRGLVLVPACLVAVLAMRVKEDMNDTRSLSVGLILRLVFLVVMIVTSILTLDTTAVADLMGYGSILLSLDVIVAVAVYILPKFRGSEDLGNEILPDVFVHTTVAFLDITGFTAWSSCREPVAIFKFLEALYQNFDRLAEQNGVYKVETVRDSYVAATGIPKFQVDHATRMAEFVYKCLTKMPKYLRNLEIQFGPDTSDMSLRAGLHSGPVTGGFLKGKGSRFQLFGDTVTTATILENHCASGRVLLSEATANLLIKAGKTKWVMEREDKVVTATKGLLKTYWLVMGRLRSGLDQEDFSNAVSIKGDGDSDMDEGEMESQQRYIEWNVEVFKGLLKQILAKRATLLKGTCLAFSGPNASPTIPLEEVKEVIELPDFDKKGAHRQREHADIEIPDKVVQELREFINAVAERYNPNPFHNFSHASYVVMAVAKYMNRIIAGTEMDLADNDDRFRSSVQAALHNHTYGITSDPLTQFACLFAALIHDVDHPGVPNPQLIKEDEAVASKYKNRSVAEQKSLDIAMALINEDRFETLRAAICQSPQEAQRFRQLVVNSVMATDLGDKELKALRNSRWEKAFANAELSSKAFNASESSNTESLSGEPTSPLNAARDTINRKATIVIEHLLQAADVAHMSQHWTIYRKWNERLFRETYKAFREGRSETSPAEGWYKGEIGFFDFYIIPLCEKIRDCGVFGPTSDENLNYATNNRNLWFKEGEEIVRDMLARLEKEYQDQEDKINGVATKTLTWSDEKECQKEEKKEGLVTQLSTGEYEV